MRLFGFSKLSPGLSRPGVTQIEDAYLIQAQWRRQANFQFEYKAIAYDQGGKPVTTTIVPWNLTVQSVDDGIGSLVITGGPTNVNGRTEGATKEIYTVRLDPRLATNGTGRMPIGGDLAPVYPRDPVKVGDTWEGVLTVPTAIVPIPSTQVFSFDGPGSVNGQNVVVISSRLNGTATRAGYASLSGQGVVYVNVKDGMIEKSVYEIKLRTAIEGAQNDAWQRASAVYRRVR